jgi:peptidoglycan/LPS O-acetylase OafA/YrhL
MSFPVPAAQTHLTHPKYRADIDGLRAIAVLSVLGFHAFPNWIQGGFIGVDIFFVISGFLISTIIFENLQRDSFSFVEFYIRRIKRIFPAMLLVMTACMVLGWFVLLADEYKQLGKHIAGGAGFVANLMFWDESGYFDNSAGSKPLLHLWSLGIEEQFYIIWPLLLWAAWKLRWNLLKITISVAIVSFTLNIGYVRSDVAAAFYLPQTRFWELMTGSILAHMTLYRPKLLGDFIIWLGRWTGRTGQAATGNRYDAAQSILGAALIVTGVLVIGKDRQFPGWWALLPTAGAVLVISAGAHAWLNRVVLSQRALVWFGLISYPLYLWHWPLLSFARIMKSETPSIAIRIVAVMISIALAWLTYMLVEKPIRFARGQRSATILILVSIWIALATAGLCIWGANGYNHRHVYGLVRQPPMQILRQEYHLGKHMEKCDENGGYSEQYRKFCVAEINRRYSYHIVLWGDSHVVSWGPVLAKIAIDKDYRLTVVKHEGCPPLVGVRRTDGIGNFHNCSDLQDTANVLDDILKQKPDLVVIAGRWSMYANGWIREGELEPETHYLTTSNILSANLESSRAAIESQLPKTVKKILMSGVNVLVIKNPPILKHNINNYREFVEVTRLENEEFSKLTNDVISKISGMEIFDPSSKLCSGEYCIAYSNDQPLYRDDNHLSSLGSMYFYDEIEKLILKIKNKDAGLH